MTATVPPERDLVGVDPSTVSKGRARGAFMRPEPDMRCVRDRDARPLSKGPRGVDADEKNSRFPGENKITKKGAFP